MHNEERPSSLYKYFPPCRVAVLENLKVKFSQPIEFNDIFEFLPGVDELVDYEQVRKTHYLETRAILTANRHWTRPQRKAFKIQRDVEFKRWRDQDKRNPSQETGCKTVQRVLSAMTYIFSLSGRWDNILMWSHYCDNHRGFVIEFDGRHEFFQVGFQKVHYSDERPMWKPNANGMNEPGLFTTKSCDWAYEDEYRIIYHDGEKIVRDGEESLMQVVNLDDVARAMRPPKLVGVPAAAVRGIILGHRIEDETTAQIEKALENSRLSHVTLSNARPHRQFYHMERELSRFR